MRVIEIFRYLIILLTAASFVLFVYNKKAGTISYGTAVGQLQMTKLTFSSLSISKNDFTQSQNTAGQSSTLDSDHVIRNTCDSVSILNFNYGQLLSKENLKATCKLDFDCTFVQDGYPNAKNVWNYSAVMVFGEPGYKRFKQYISKTRVRNPNQIWVAKGAESSNSRRDFNIGNDRLDGLFNWTMAISADATIEITPFNVVPKTTSVSMQDVVSTIGAMNKSKPLCWMVSQCSVQNNRFKMGSHLINDFSLRTHMWGAAASKCMPWLQKHKIADHGVTNFAAINRGKSRDEIRAELMQGCKFYIAFENSNCTYYVTEKLTNAYAAGAIPIVNGWRDIYEQRLPGSFIHVSDFNNNMTALASYLDYLLKNETAFFQYHAWRKNFDTFGIYYRRREDCQLCRKVSETVRANREGKENRTVIESVADTFRKLQTCY